jgi:hypothetical protein
MAEQPQTAIGYSIIANLGDDRQITVQHFIGDDQDDAAVNATMDRIMGFIDRQKAIRKIPELRAEKRQVEGQMVQMERDLVAVEADYKAASDARDAQIINLRGKAKAEHDAGYAEHANTGRRGAYKPVGQRAATIDRIEADVQKLVEEAVKQAGEREVALQNLNANTEMRRVRIAQIDEEIAELEAKVG